MSVLFKAISHKLVHVWKTNSFIFQVEFDFLQARVPFDSQAVLEGNLRILEVEIKGYQPLTSPL